MVVAAELVTALVTAGVLAYLFAKHIRRRGRRSGFFWFFLLIFMVTWAGGIWLVPFGPMIMGIHWLPFALIGLLGALVISLLADRRYPANRHETIELLAQIQEERERDRMTYLSLSAVFWATLLVLAVAVVLRYTLR
jgi:hypothetical protein